MYFRQLVCVCLLAPLSSGSLPPASLQSSLSSLISPNLCQLKLICAIYKSENNQLRDSVFMRGISTLADLTAGTFLGNLTTDAFLLQYSIEAGVCIFKPKPCLDKLSRVHDSCFKVRLAGPAALWPPSVRTLSGSWCLPRRSSG